MNVGSHALVALAIALACAACAQPVDFAGVTHRSAAIVYGADDRVEPLDHPDSAWLPVVDHSLVALIETEKLRFDRNGAATIKAPRVADVLQLCDGEQFGAQPAAATCSGILIAPDLVLTAGHCVQGTHDCSAISLVFGYRNGPEGSVRDLLRDDVYGCREIVVSELTPSDAPTLLDYAVLRLDRPALHGQPVVVSEAPRTAGERLALVATPFGAPAKIDSNGSVVDPRSDRGDYFGAVLDSFEGGSGGPVFALDQSLVGFVLGGVDDLRPGVDGGCRVALQVDDNAGVSEAVALPGPALAALCARFTVDPLCDLVDGCGDGECSGVETRAWCARDCQPRDDAGAAMREGAAQCQAVWPAGAPGPPCWFLLSALFLSGRRRRASGAGRHPP